MVYEHQSKSSSWTPTPRKSSFFPPAHIQTKTETKKGSELVGKLPSKAQRDKIRRSLFGDIPEMTGAKAETASTEAKEVENPTQVSEEAASGEIQRKAETGLSQSQGYGVPSREVRNKIRRRMFGNLEPTPLQKQEEEGTSPLTSILEGEGSQVEAGGEEKELAETEITLPIQAKLTIGEPNDKYEQEADRVARQVVDKIHSPTPETVQREEMGDEDEVRLKSEAGSGGKVEAGVGVTGVRMSPIEGVKVNRKVNSEGETQEASADLEASIQGKRGSGQPLDESVREPMEREFGADFSGVRVHTDGKADELNQAIQAKAFTTGEDIFFREGAYEPGSKGGQELLAHELTHVVQQSGGAVQRQHKIIHDPSDLEHQADFAVVSAPFIKSVNAQHVVQRASNFRQFMQTKIPPGNALYQEAHCIAILLDHNEYERKETMEGVDLDADLTTAVNWLKTHASLTAHPNADSGQLMQRLNFLMKSVAPGAYSNIQWGAAKLWGAGTEVRASLHRDGHASGSDAGGDPEWMLNLQQRVNRHGTSLYVRGHLLNRHLGGPGLDYNMVPLTQSGDWGANDANGAHSSSIEETVKRIAAKLETGQADQVTNLMYHVKAVYPRPPRPQTAQIGMWLTQLNSILTDFQKRVSEVKNANLVNIDTQTDAYIQTEWKKVSKTHIFPTPNGQYQRQATIDALRSGYSRTELDVQIQKLPMGMGMIGTWLLNQLAANTILQSVLRAVSPNHNYKLISLSNLHYRMQENAKLWQLEDKIIPQKLELDASWDQFGNHEAVDDEVKIRLPSSLNADMKLRND